MKNCLQVKMGQAFIRRTAGVTAALVFQMAVLPAASASTLTSTGSEVIPSYSSTFQLPGYLETVALLEGTSTAPTTSGKTYYLSTGGSNSNSGAQNSAWKTLSYAVSKLKAGDTLYIQDGVYKEDAISRLTASGTANSYIKIIGIGDVVLDGALKKASNGGNYAPVISTNGKSYVYFENLQFKNSRGIEMSDGSHDIIINGLSAADNEYAVVMRSVHNITIRNANVTRSYFAFRGEGDTHDVLMENINVSYSSSPNIQADGYQNGDGFIFESDTYNLTFRKITASYSADAGMDIKGSNVLIENLVSHHNTMGLKLWGTNVNVVNALIYGLFDQISPVGRLTPAVGINVRSGKIRVYNSTIVGTGGESLIKPTFGASLHIENSIVALSSSSGRLYTALGTLTQKNVLWYRMGKSTAEFSIPSGSLWANPGFLNWNGNDYRLTSSSAALNRGASNSIVPSYDLAMNARLTGSALDLGAFELAAAGNQPPVLTAPSSQTISENSAISLQLQGSDPEGKTLTYSAAGLPAGSVLNASTGLFTWTPSFDQAGSYDVTFRASDGASQVSRIVNFLVQNTNRQPVFQSLGDQTGTAGDPILFSVFANDPDGDAVTLAALNLPAGAVFDPAGKIFSWTPSVTQVGDFNVSFTANDGKTTSTRSVWIAVLPAEAPVPTPAPAAPAPIVTTETYEPFAVVDAQRYSLVSDVVLTPAPGVLGMYGNRSITYDVNVAETGDYSLHLSTAQITTKSTPSPDYKFAINVFVGDRLVGVHNFASETTFVLSDKIVLGRLAAGFHKVTLQWVNDARVEGTTIDANLGIRDLVFSKKFVPPPSESPVTAPPVYVPPTTELSPVLALDAQDYSFVSDAVNTSTPGLLSMYGNRTIDYDIQLSETAEYAFHLSTAQVTSKSIPSPDYLFEVNVLVDGRLVGTYDLAADNAFTVSDEVDLGFLSSGAHQVRLQWINDFSVENTTMDSNLGIRDLIFSKKVLAPPVPQATELVPVLMLNAQQYSSISDDGITTPPVSDAAPGEDADLLLADSFTNTGDSAAAVTPVGGAALTSDGKYGEGFSFNGTAGIEVRPPSGFGFGSGDFTVDLWVNPSALGYSTLWSQGTDSMNYMYLFVRDGNLGFNAFLNNGYVVNLSTVAGLPLNAWTHLAVVRNGDTMTLYRNGSALANIAFSGAIPTYTGPILVGRLNAGGQDYGYSFTGKMDEVRFSSGVARWTGNFTPPADPHGTATDAPQPVADTSEPGILGMYGNRSITYDVNLAGLAEYALNLSTAQITSKSIPYPGYQFKISVVVDDRIIGDFDFAADKVFRVSDKIDLGLLSAGSHKIKLLWTNDMNTAIGEDSNLGIRDIVISKKVAAGPAETPSPVASISALDYTDANGSVSEYGDGVLATYSNRWIKYTITAATLDRYHLTLLTAQMSSKSVPADYKFHLDFYVDNTLKASYDAEALKTFTETGFIDLGVLGAGEHVLAVEWTNDTMVEGTTIDTNLGIKDLVLHS